MLFGVETATTHDVGFLYFGMNLLLILYRHLVPHLTTLTFRNIVFLVNDLLV